MASPPPVAPSPAALPSQPNVDQQKAILSAANAEVIYFHRILISCIGGCASGILGITGLYGVVAYAITYLLLTVTILGKMNFAPQNFNKSALGLVWEGVTDGLLSFILFWALLYNIVHIYI